MKLLTRTTPSLIYTSYAQCGEDVIVDYLFTRTLKIDQPTYLDLGAYHPTQLSNTYYFYRKGARGVCVEPDPYLFKQFRAKRRRDLCVNAGVGAASVPAVDFYIMSPRTLNTFSREEADQFAKNGVHRIHEVIQVPVISINDLIQRYCQACPNFISLDVEGLDFEIIQAMDFDRHRPQAMCVETLEYRDDRTAKKRPEITAAMAEKGYFVYADTYINTIYVDQQAWEARP